MYIFRTIPPEDVDIQPQQLISGSREKFNKVLMKVREKLASSSTLVQIWERWDSDIFPQTDDVQDYVNSGNQARAFIFH
jgi:hypothetical protein